MKRVFLYGTIAFSSGLFFTNIYNSIVNASNWENNIPTFIIAARDFFAAANPGTFFKWMDPLNLLLVILSLVIFWKTQKSVRLYLIVALLCYIASMLLTFTYFYPRNEIMFLNSPISEIDQLQKAASEWGFMNWFRSGIWLIGLLCSFLALHVLTTKKKGSSVEFNFK